jgi:diguanylate cyclase (GGDEF)-like protein
MFAHSQAKHQDLAVGLMDIDFFKKVNDTHGHTAGDEALKLIGALLGQVFTPPALVARYGGEEFCVLAPGIDKPRALMQFNSLRKLVERTPVHAGQEVFSLTISIGLATSPGSDLEGMIRRADELLYQAKSRGRNRVVLEG